MAVRIRALTQPGHSHEPPTAAERTAQLERERRAAPLAAAAAAAGLLLPGGLVVGIVLMGRGAPDRNNGAILRFIDAHASEFVLSQAVSAIGFACLAAVAWYLWIGTRFRRPDAPRAIAVTGIAGPIIAAAGMVAMAVGLAVAANGFAASEFQTVKAAEDALGSPPLFAFQGILSAATLATAFWFVLGSLNAMRVGLLTRQMGITGVILGPLYVVVPWRLPILVLIALWLVALAVLFRGRWPGGRPAAWQSGTAVPWPPGGRSRGTAAGGQSEIVDSRAV